ncbi:hypothetical protein [Streptomyces sp. TRM64462]|uniref:hypothetical protein n=1 Tax=Streptomyces sp. TRM64462 TaxID=2741726 RepID=UPI001586D560|nr:hypothetical protein [Streptomyces sp. TRM64462]
MTSRVPRGFAAVEIDRVDWAAFRVLGGGAHEVPEALRRLVAARSEDEAWEAYWRLENAVVVQGALHSAALPAVGVLLAALLDELSADARDLVLELLRQITAGEADGDEVACGNGDLGPRCRDAARKGLWLLYRELGTRRRETAEAILERVEDDPVRLAAYRERVRGRT